MDELHPQEIRDRWNWHAGAPAMAGLIAVLNHFLLSAALFVSLGFLDFPSLGVISFVLLSTLAGSCLTWPEALSAAAATFLPFAMYLVVAAEFAGLCFVEIGLFRFPALNYLPFVCGMAPLALLLLSYAWKQFPLPRCRFWTILVLYFFLGAWHISASPQPKVDVWHFQQTASRALLKGENPYTTEYPNSLGDESFYSPAVIKDGKVQSLPYTPLSLMLVLPGYLAGDVRWSVLVAVIVTAALLVATGRKLGLPPGHIAELAAVAFLCHPLGLVMVEYAWTDPLVTLCAAFCLWALVAYRDRALGLGIGALLSIKQYAVLAIIPFWSLKPVDRRDLVLAIAVVVGINLPFFLWDPAGFWMGLVTFQLDSPFRPESLTFLAAVNALTGHQLPSIVGFVAASVVAAQVLLFARRSLTTRVLGAAAIFLAFFAFNKGAHINYYWFVGSLLPLAIVTSASERKRDDAQAEDDHAARHRTGTQK